MNIHLSKRNTVRLVTFSIAIIATLLAFLIVNIQRADSYERKLQRNFLSSITSLASSTDNISNTLKKGLYAGSPEMLMELSSKLWHDSSIAKSAMSQLPMGEGKLEKTYKFLSQVGNYSLSIAEKASNGEGLSLEEYTNLASLSDYSEQLQQEMWDFETGVMTGRIGFSDLYEQESQLAISNPPEVYEGFVSMEEGFESYPTLIYDGPFSDHLLEKEPLLIKGSPTVSIEDAKKTASISTDIPIESLVNNNDEMGKMPSYCFDSDNTTISVTKAGGLLSYIIKAREVSETKLTVNDALSTANAFLIKLGIKDMVTTYYETYGNICTINFASSSGDTVIYTDLIKVSVALDNGEITGYDARGYIVNHTERAIPEPQITLENAQATLSPLLKSEKSRLVIIPTKGEREVLCYEFNCMSRNETNVLVYINAITGEEEQILLVFKSKDGVLTM